MKECQVVNPLIASHLRNELEPAASARVVAHLELCVDCAAEAESARRASAVLARFAGELDTDLPEFVLQATHVRTMAAIRSQPRVDSSRQGWFAFAAAAAVAVVAVLAGVRGGDVASPAVAVVPALSEAVALLTTQSADGTILRWQGAEPTYWVLKSRHPGDFKDAEIEVVCGTSWTDRARNSGIVYYQVVAAGERCRA